MKNSIFVIKLGGEIIDKPKILKQICKETGCLIQTGIQVIVIHGGGNQATQWGEKLNHKPNIIHGRRITDEKTLDIVKMVFAGKINIELLSVFREAGIPAVGLSGVDGNILHACKRPPQHNIDYGFVGDILSVNPELIFMLMEKKFLPVIAPLACDENGVIYNINADTVASAIAVALQADKWIILSNIDGIYDAQKNYLSHLTCAQARALIQQGAITAGMIPKVESIISAVQSGIKSVQIINGAKSGALSMLLSQQSIGTTFMEDTV
jgi:acetylglutamate kinase